MNYSINYSILNRIVFIFILLSIFSSSILICRVTVFLIMLLCISIAKNDRFIVTPMSLFALTPFSLLIYKNFGDAYMVNLKFETWLIAIINMYAFVMAYKYTPSFSNFKKCIGNADAKLLQIQAVVFYLLSLVGKFIPSIESIVWMFSIASVVCALKSRKRTMYIFVIVIFLVSALGVTSKSTMLTYCITFIICIEKYIFINEKQRKWIKLILALGVLFMIFTFSFANKGRETHSSEESLELYSRRGIEWNYSAGLFMPYMYITNGWTNLQHAMNTQDTRTYGLWSLKPLLGYLQLDENFKDDYSLKSYSSFNTFAYMTYGFKDFGYWLSILMSLFLGYFVKKVYSRYSISRSPYDVASFVLVAQATLEMFFSNHFFSLSYPFTIVILMSMIKFFMRKRVNAVELEN